MRKFEDYVLNQNGTPVVNATVTVFIAGGGVLAQLFSDDIGTPLLNPVTTGAQGRFNFYIADGRYDIQVSGTGINTYKALDQEIIDAIDSLNTTDSNWLVRKLGISTAPTAALEVAPIATAGQIGARFKGNLTANADVLEVYNSAASPALQSWFDSTGLLGTNLNLSFKAGTANTGTLTHAITVPRTWTFPDTTGTLALSNAPGTAGTDVAWIAGVLNVPSASASARGVITTGAQTLAGQKTFSNGLLSIDNVTGIVASGDNTKVLVFDVSGITTGTTRTHSILDASGTVPVRVATFNATLQTASILSTVLYTVPATGAGFYRLSWYMPTSLSGTGTTVTLALSWNDGITTTSGNVAITDLSTTVNTPNGAGGSVTFYSTALQNITYTATVGSIGTSKYDLRLRLEAF